MASLMANITGKAVEHLVKPIFHPNYPIVKQRKRMDFLRKFAPSPSSVEKIEINIAGIPAWRLTPSDSQRPHQQLLYLHGGGYVSGSPKSHGDMVARLARATGLPTTLIDYRLAPESPFPAGLEDAVKVYQELAQYGPVYIAGDSAGGGLTLALMQKIRTLGLRQPEALVLFSPWTDLSCSGEAFESRKQREKLLTQGWIRKMVPSYTAGHPINDPLVSPLNADFTGFPPTLIQVGSEEILYSDSTRLHEKMTQAGVPAVLTEYPEMWHVFQLHAGYMQESRQALQDVARFIDDLN